MCLVVSCGGIEGIQLDRKAAVKQNQMYQLQLLCSVQSEWLTSILLQYAEVKWLWAKETSG